MEQRRLRLLAMQEAQAGETPNQRIGMPFRAPDPEPSPEPGMMEGLWNYFGGAPRANEAAPMPSPGPMVDPNKAKALRKGAGW